MRAYIFDIDGTIANCEHRLHYIAEKPKNWDAFFDACKDDKPIEAICQLLADLWPFKVVYVTGRPERCRQATVEWLQKHALPSRVPLYMRADGDHRQDDVIKPELLKRLREDGYEPIMAFEDRARVVDIWRANGVPCAQVAPGDF